jgi:2-oxo-3-hexenedioate decarboxylase
MLAAMDAGRDPAPDVAAAIPDLATAQAFQDQINRMRLARGEQAAGFKIGFTNRTIWERYGVFAPIWAPVWNTTVVPIPSGPRPFDAGAPARRLNRPRLEPEIVLGLRTIPAAGDLAAIEQAIEWVAHGFELVQSPWPAWRFDACQAIAAQSLHGALLVGPRRRVVDSRGLAAALSDLEIDLACDDRVVAHGHGRDVLDGPLQALGQWLATVIGAAGATVPLPAAVAPAPGMLVTTGTLTDAQTVVAGARWQSRLIDRDGAVAARLEQPLADLSVVFGERPSGVA